MEYEFKFSQQDLSLIYAGLGELPLKLGVHLFARLQQEQAKQDKAQRDNEEGK